MGQFCTLINIEAILDGQPSLFGLHADLEKEAQRIASQITKRQALQQPVSTVSTDAAKEYQAVNLDSLQYNDVRTIGAEYVGHHAACQLGNGLSENDFICTYKVEDLIK